MEKAKQTGFKRKLRSGVLIWRFSNYSLILSFSTVLDVCNQHAMAAIERTTPSLEQVQGVKLDIEGNFPLDEAVVEGQSLCSC